MQCVEILRRLVGFDTTSTLPNRALIDFVRDYLDGLGVASTILASDDGAKACLWATIGSGVGPGVVLAGHTDVVPVAGQAWRSDPFVLTERDGNLYGRGACDMKGFIACVLAVAPALAQRNLARPVHFAFTYDEETTMAGAARLTDYVRGQGIVPHWVWIGEPTSLQMIDQHKGCAYYETVFTGVAGHSGQPDKGLNAIECAQDFIGILRDVAGAKRDKPFQPSRFEPPYSTLNIAMIEGGTAENIIPGQCTLRWQTRAHPGDDMAATLAAIQAQANMKLSPRFAAFAPSAGMKTCTCFDIPPLLPTPNNPGVAVLGGVTGVRETQAVSFATEGGFFQKLGTSVVICGPGSIEQAHQPDEFVARAQLAACEKLLRQVLLA